MHHHQDWRDIRDEAQQVLHGQGRIFHIFWIRSVRALCRGQFRVHASCHHVCCVCHVKRRRTMLGLTSERWSLCPLIVVVGCLTCCIMIALWLHYDHSIMVGVCFTTLSVRVHLFPCHWCTVLIAMHVASRHQWFCAPPYRHGTEVFLLCVIPKWSSGFSGQLRVIFRHSAVMFACVIITWFTFHASMNMAFRCVSSDFAWCLPSSGCSWLTEGFRFMISILYVTRHIRAFTVDHTYLHIVHVHKANNNRCLVFVTCGGALPQKRNRTRL